MSIRRIRDLLNGSLKRAGIYQKVNAAQIIDATKKIIQNHWGRSTLERVIPNYIQDGVLTITVKDSVYAAELKLKEEELLKEINQSCKTTAVKKLRLLVK